LTCKAFFASSSHTAVWFAFAGFRFPAGLIVWWCLRYGLSHRAVEELLVEPGVEVDHMTGFRWVQRFAPLLADAVRFCRHSSGDR
jgi:transposase-like protein